MKLSVLFFLFCAVACDSFASDQASIRIGVQATGTLAWELAVLENDKEAASRDFKIETLAVANAEAGKIALQSGAVDMIVSDWIWVSRLRADGTDFTFYPYSMTSGSLIVPENSSIHSVKDLKGKRLGIAGGELDKNWLLLQALAQKEQLDLSRSVDKTYGAPPLINEQIKQGRIDAALNYWHFGAQLEAKGFRQIINGSEIVQQLGIPQHVPTLGYVFKQSWANQHKNVLDHFLSASKKAKDLLCQSDADWQRTQTLVNTDEAIAQPQLRKRYCEGLINQWGPSEQQAAEHIYTLLRTVSKNQLTGKSEHLQPGTFWSSNE